MRCFPCAKAIKNAWWTRAAKLLKQGFELDATHGTAIVLGEAGINPRLVNKVHEGRPHIQDRIKNGEYTYIINTTSGRRAIEDSA